MRFFADDSKSWSASKIGWKTVPVPVPTGNPTRHLDLVPTVGWIQRAGADLGVVVARAQRRVDSMVRLPFGSRCGDGRGSGAGAPRPHVGPRGGAGFLPMALAMGVGAEVQRPLATSSAAACSPRRSSR